MKSAVLVFAVAATATGLLASDARADATVAFVINDRPAKVPVARVRWNFALAGAPAGASASINGVAASVGMGFVSLPNGDRFRLDGAPTMNSGQAVSLLYEARSHFDPSDFCQLKAGLPANTLPKTVTVNFSGPQITQHALGAYTVAGVTKATTLLCQQAKRRVQDGYAVNTPPPAPAPAAPQRLPLDVILVLDKSGSMGWELPGSAPNSLPTRWTALGTALDQFVALWDQASESGVTGDRLGLVHFDSTGQPADFGGGSIFRTRGNWASLLAQAKGKSPGGSTAIGDGLNKAIGKWVSDPANFDAAVILMTDGEQNVDPRIAKIAGTDDWALGAVGAPVAGTDELYRKGLPIQTIGFGTPASIETDLLSGIAAQTAGTSIVTATATGLSTAMQDVLLQALKGNTLGLLARTTGTVAGIGAPPIRLRSLPAAAGASAPTGPLSAPIPLQVDPSVRRVTVVLDWVGRSNLFRLWLQPPGGTAIKPSLQKLGSSWLVASVDVPADGPGGEWNALVEGNDISAPTPFRLSAYAVDSRLKYALNFGRDSSGTGDAIPLMVEATYDGKPLTGIAGGIRIRPASPAESAGNILHAAATAGPDPRPDQSATTAKALSLAVTDKLLERIEPKPTGQQLILSDAGTSGDTSANDGVYTGSVSDTRVPGRYRFDVALEWDDPRTGKVRRIESIERVVSAIPNSGQTVVAIAAPTGDGVYQVKVTPRDRFGNHVGPGYGRVVQVKVSGSGIVGPVADPLQTGDYTVRISGVAPGTTPGLDIWVDGRPVRTGQPLKPGTSGGEYGPIPGPGPGPGSSPYALWLAGGIAIPHGKFADTQSTGPALAIGIDYAFSSDMSLEGTVSWHRLDGKTGQPNAKVTQVGLNGKWYFSPGTGPMRPFATLGAGVYSFDPGKSRLGFNIGLGGQWQVAPQWSVEGRYQLHAVTSNSPQSVHSTLLLGLRYSY
ncbi:choice-of-anchor X domain-containing protein [Roseateles amylovorans]|uniref:Outer membrane beta-barrel protein n=1 Tax=Roseateles amylovorans TaxID=2978473 RepID=A0ABY6B192_9BURK|nr:outer membrane beta-barrel protein [Roseateles amylovorans]UXH79172.1 outer membrane beta-barrel protein [Roseateles amylovorans]